MVEARQAVTLEAEGVRHGFFTRIGGVSEGMYAALNCGSGSKDDPARVAVNRARVAELLAAAPDRLVTPWQVHSPTALHLDRPFEGERPKADALVTGTPGLAIGVLTADCAPVLFLDPVARVIGAAHAGWRGALTGIVEATVACMAAHGAAPERIRAAVGPCISVDNYEVGDEFVAGFLAVDADLARYFRDGPGDRSHFDLPAFVAHRLSRLGLASIEIAEDCTYRDESKFFSFRRATHRQEPDYGRQISAIVLN